MKQKELIPEVKAKVDEWLGAGEYTLLFCWRDEYHTHYIVAQQERKLYFLRIFKLGGVYQLSQDKDTEIKQYDHGTDEPVYEAIVVGDPEMKLSVFRCRACGSESWSSERMRLPVAEGDESPS